MYTYRYTYLYLHVYIFICIYIHKYTYRQARHHVARTRAAPRQSLACSRLFRRTRPQSTRYFIYYDIVLNVVSLLFFHLYYHYHFWPPLSLSFLTTSFYGLSLSFLIIIPHTVILQLFVLFYFLILFSVTTLSHAVVSSGVLDLRVRSLFFSTTLLFVFVLFWVRWT